MTDPRLQIITKRFDGVRRIIVFAGGKGGVGKSSCVCVSALLAAQGGCAAGLLDLDFQGASAHILLGAEPALPEEEGGILPMLCPGGLKFISPVFFTGEGPLAMRGNSTTDAILELFAVTRWGELDALFIDMPPGAGDEVLDILRFIPRAELVVITTPSALSLQVTARFEELLKRLRVQYLGTIMNMADAFNTGSVRTDTNGYLGSIPFCSGLEAQIGNTGELLAGEFAENLKPVLRNLGFQLSL